jgi:hypothetical protein
LLADDGDPEKVPTAMEFSADFDATQLYDWLLVMKVDLHLINKSVQTWIKIAFFHSHLPNVNRLEVRLSTPARTEAETTNHNAAFSCTSR